MVCVGCGVPGGLAVHLIILKAMQTLAIILIIAAALGYLGWRAWREVRGVSRYGRCYGCSLAASCNRAKCKKAAIDHHAKIHTHE